MILQGFVVNVHRGDICAYNILNLISVLYVKKTINVHQLSSQSAAKKTHKMLLCVYRQQFPASLKRLQKTKFLNTILVRVYGQICLLVTMSALPIFSHRLIQDC